LKKELIECSSSEVSLGYLKPITIKGAINMPKNTNIPNQSQAQTEEAIPRNWWLSFDSPLYFDRWILLGVTFSYSLISFIMDPHHAPNLFAPSGAIITLAGLFLNIKQGQLFHKKNLTLKKKSDTYNGCMVLSDDKFTLNDQIVINKALLDEKFGTIFMIIGTIIWAYG
jgi:hypothetical protein